MRPRTPAPPLVPLYLIGLAVLILPRIGFADIEPFLKLDRLTLPNGAEVLIESTESNSTLAVLHEGLPVIRVENRLILDVRTQNYLSEVPEQELADYNGDGWLDWAFLTWTRAAHGGRDLHIVTFEPRPRMLTQIEFDHWDGKAPRDIDGDGLAEVLIKDWTYAYWRTSFAMSPAPDVWVTLNGDRFELNHELTRISPDEAADIMATIPEVKAAKGEEVFENIPSSLVWGGVLDLVYGGHPELAAKFFAETWPYSAEAAVTFLAAFKKAYSDSEWYPDLKPYWDIFEEALAP